MANPPSFDELPIDQVLRVGAGNDPTGILREQLRALLQPTKHVEHSTPLGAALGGLAEVLDGTVGAFQAKDLRAKLKDGDTKQAADRGALLRQALDTDTAGEDAYNQQLSPKGRPVTSAAPGGIQGGNGPADPMASLGQYADGEGATPKERGEAMARALRAGRRLNSLLAASGDPTLQKFGEQELSRYERELGAARQRDTEDRGYSHEASNYERDRAAKASDYARGRGDNEADYERDRHAKLTDTASEQAWREQQGELDRKSAERAAALAANRSEDREGRAEQRALDREERAAGKKTEAAARDVEERYQNITRSLDDLEQQVKESGTWDLMGPANAKLEGLITSYATDMAKLRDPTSVAREGEVELEKKGLFSPGLTTRNSTALEMIKTARDRVKARRDEAYTVRGLEAPGPRKPTGNAQQQQGPKTQQPSGETKTVGGRTFQRTAGGGWQEVK